MSIFALKKDQKSDPISIEGTGQGGSVAKPGASSGIAVRCIKVYPEYCIAKVASYGLGNRLMHYQQDAAIRPGSLCEVSVFSGIPVIVGEVNFGMDPKDCFVLDLDANEDNLRPVEIIDWGGEIDPKSYDTDEIDCYEYVSVKKDFGEKVYNVELSGLKLGFVATELFYDFDSFVKLSSGKAEISGKDLSIETGFYDFYSVSEFDGEGGFSISEKNLRKHSSNKIDKAEDEDSFTYRYCFSGNVSKAIGEAEIKLPKMPSFNLDITDFVEAKIIVMPDDGASRDEKTDSSFKYEDRMLIVNGSGKSSVNEDLLVKSNSTKDTLISGGLKMSISEDSDILLTFFEGITIHGDTYKYQAGRKIEVVIEDETKLNASALKEFIFGDFDHSFQQNATIEHFPVLENSSYSFICYSDYITSFKGNTVSTSYKNQYNELRNSTTVYETKEALDTVRSFENKESTVVMEKKISSYIEYREIPEVSKTIFDNRKFTDRSGDTIINLGGEGFIAYLAKKTINSDASIVITPDALVVDMKDSIFSCDFNYTSMKNKSGMAIKGGLYLDGGFVCKDDFYVKSKNIILESEEILYMKSSTAYSISKKNVLEYEELDYSFCSAEVEYDSVNDREKRNVIKMSNVHDIFMQGEDLTFVSGNALNEISDGDINISARKQLNLADSDGVDT